MQADGMAMGLIPSPTISLMRATIATVQSMVRQDNEYRVAWCADGVHGCMGGPATDWAQWAVLGLARTIALNRAPAQLSTPDRGWHLPTGGDCSPYHIPLHKNMPGTPLPSALQTICSAPQARASSPFLTAATMRGSSKRTRSTAWVAAHSQTAMRTSVGRGAVDWHHGKLGTIQSVLLYDAEGPLILCRVLSLRMLIWRVSDVLSCALLLYLQWQAHAACMSGRSQKLPFLIHV